MKRFLPLILSALITAAVAGLVAWGQQVRMAGLRDRIAARAAASPVAAVRPADDAKSAPAAPPAASPDFQSVISRTKSRSALRAGQELRQYYQTCPIEELRAVLEDSGSNSFSSLGTAGAFVIAMSVLAERDLAAAVACVGKLQGETSSLVRTREEAAIPAAMILLNDWMLRDKKAALAWFHGLKDQRLKGTMLTGATVCYGSSQPQLVEELRNGISDEGERERAERQAVEALASTDPEAALRKVNEIPEPDQRRDAERTALLSLARKEPQKALGMMMLNAAPDARKVNDGDAARALTEFINQNRAAATQWMSAQDPAVIARLFAADPNLAKTAAAGQ